MGCNRPEPLQPLLVIDSGRCLHLQGISARDTPGTVRKGRPPEGLCTRTCSTLSVATGGSVRITAVPEKTVLFVLGYNFLQYFGFSDMERRNNSEITAAKTAG